MKKYFITLLLTVFVGAVSPVTGASQDPSTGSIQWLIEDLVPPEYTTGSAAYETYKASSTDDSQFVSQWTTQGTDFWVTAVANSNAGIVVGGNFLRAGDVQANHIAIWDPATGSWDNMNGGLTDASFGYAVQSIAVDGDNIYVGGDFDEAGGVAVSNIAVYSISTGTWAALGSGVDHDVTALLVVGGQLYAGGAFSNAGGSPAAKIARWDGSSWSPLSDGFNGNVYALEIFNNELYAGGDFSASGAVTVSNIARFDGTAWHAVSDGVGEGVNDKVTALESNGNTLYIGGDFSEAAGVSGFNRVASWNSATTSFAPLGAGFNKTVHDLEHSGTTLYATGIFEESGISETNYIATWNGTIWEELDGGLWANSLALLGGQDIEIVGSSVYVGGYLAGAGTTAGTGVIGHDGSDWFTLGNGESNAPVGTVAHSVIWDMAQIQDGFVAVGGLLEFAGSTPGSVFQWNENNRSWTTLGTVTLMGSSATTVNKVVLDGDKLYIGGLFDNVDGVPVSNIAMYNTNTSTWSDVGSGVDGPVTALYVDGSNVYVGGQFNNAGGSPAANIAIWNGSAWTPLGNGTDGVVRSIVRFQSEIYIGGDFGTAGGNTANNMARWNGATWSPVDDGTQEGTNSSVYSLEAVGDTVLYISGHFDAAGSVPASRIARWDGTSFSALGTGLSSGTVYEILMAPDGLLYAVGVVEASGSTPVNGAAAWDGTQWSALGSGFNYINIGGGPIAMSVSENGKDLYFGGLFSFAGGKPAHNLARYSLTPSTVIEDPSSPAKNSLVVSSYPNPFTDFATLEVDFDRADRVTIRVYDILGREVSTVASNATVSAGPNKFTVDGSGLQSGVYIYRVETSDRVATGVLSHVR